MGSGSVATLRERIERLAQAAPAPDAVRLAVGGVVCGTLSPPVAWTLLSAGFARQCPAGPGAIGTIALADWPEDPAERNQRLGAIARHLLQNGFSGPWRDELLAIRPDPDRPPLGCIDRSAVRALGLPTESVHLNGYAADGRMVVCLRAMHKRVDPGLWDNLAGGMVAAGEDLRTAVAREALEEAGLVLDGLPVCVGGRIPVSRPIVEGLLVETVHVFDVDLPEGIRLENRDGEVARIELRSIDDVLAAIPRGEFTIEAALSALDSLERRGAAGASPR